MIPKITALAITFNEEKNIQRYIESLDFADEIIIIDSFSEDNTVEIAQKMGAIVYQNKFDDFSSQKNFALSKANYDWIVFFDLDEYISEELKNEIIENLKKSDENIIYCVKRQNIFLGEQIKFGNLKNDKVARVFHKKNTFFDGAVHEKLVKNAKKNILENKVIHKTYNSFDGYNAKLNLYSKLLADNLYLKKFKPNTIHFIFKPFFQFLWQYIFKLGFLDGKKGFVLAYLHSFAVFKTYLQLWMKYRRIN